MPLHYCYACGANLKLEFHRKVFLKGGCEVVRHSSKKQNKTKQNKQTKQTNKQTNKQTKISKTSLLKSKKWNGDGQEIIGQNGNPELAREGEEDKSVDGGKS